MIHYKKINLEHFELFEKQYILLIIFQVYYGIVYL